MKQLVFSTGNSEKFVSAQQACWQYDIILRQKNVEVTEIQAENPGLVALDKARKAFAIIKRPLVITDDSWAFAGLKGFPGIYMHSINEWFSPDDFLRLTLPLTDRAVTLTVHLVYIDKQQEKVFRRQTQGSLLREVKGKSVHASHTVITLEGDKGLSIAEAYEQAQDKSARASAKIWHEFAGWYSKP